MIQSELNLLSELLIQIAQCLIDCGFSGSVQLNWQGFSNTGGTEGSWCESKRALKLSALRMKSDLSAVFIRLIKR